jgi:hypothetical protein
LYDDIFYTVDLMAAFNEAVGARGDIGYLLHVAVVAVVQTNGVHREVHADLLFVELRVQPTSPHVHNAACADTAVFHSRLPQDLSMDRLEG